MLYDLKGKSVGFQPTKHSTIVYVEESLKAAGLGYNDVKATHAEFDSLISGLKDGTYDALILSIGLKASVISDLAVTKDITLLPLPREVGEKVVEGVPGAMYGAIPAGTYKGQDEDVLTAMILVGFFGTTALPDEITYEIMKILLEHKDEVEGINPIVVESCIDESILKSRIGTIPPLHDGILKYFKELGWIK